MTNTNDSTGDELELARLEDSGSHDKSAASVNKSTLELVKDIIIAADIDEESSYVVYHKAKAFDEIAHVVAKSSMHDFLAEKASEGGSDNAS